MDTVLITLPSLTPVPWQMWVTFGGIALAMLVYSLDRVPMEVTSAGVIVGFLVFFVLFPLPGPRGENLLAPDELLSGFSNPALLSILSLLIVGQGLYQAGALEQPTRVILRLGRHRPQVTLMAVLLLIAFTSAFMNNTPVAVVFIPIVSALANRAGFLPSQVMMPLTYMCVLGGMTTLIGSSTNLLVAQAAVQMEVAEIGFFDFTGIGVIIAAVGALYVMFVLPRFLPAHDSLQDALMGDSKQFIAEIVLHRDHPLIGATAVNGTFKQLPDIKVRLVQRGEASFSAPFKDVTLRENDIVVMVATRKALTSLLASKPQFLKGMIARASGDETLASSSSEPAGQETPQIATDLMVTEAVVAPASRFLGSSIGYIGFHQLTNCIVLGIQRRSRMYHTDLQNVRLEAGDVLLILGPRKAMKSLRSNRDLLLMEWSSVEMPNPGKAVPARWIFLGVVLSAAFGLLPVVVAAFAGALAMVMTGCLTVRQAARAIDRRIFLLVGAALAMGAALEHTGGAGAVAQAIVGALDGMAPAIVLSAFFLLVALVTNILSNNATAILFTPIAISAADQVGVVPSVFLFATIFAANSSFATPMGYQTNLLVMGPGQYSFMDYVRAGLPLTFLLWLTFSLVAPWYFGLG